MYNVFYLQCAVCNWKIGNKAVLAVQRKFPWGIWFHFTTPQCAVVEAAARDTLLSGQNVIPEIHSKNLINTQS